MKRTLFIVLLCLLPALMHAHPGKTDRYGGHKCLKGCDEWRLLPREYHLHDKDGRPIRVKLNKKTVELEPAVLAMPISEPTRTPADAAPKVETITTNRYITNVYEENLFLSNPYLFLLTALLMLLLILRVNRKKEGR